MMVHPKLSLAIILCGGVLRLQLVSASGMNVFKEKVIPDRYFTSSMAASSSCMCYKQCLVQPTCNGATYKYNASDSPIGGFVGDALAEIFRKPFVCFFSTHMLNETDLQPCKTLTFSKNVTSFLQQVERATKDPDDGMTDESSTTTTTASTTATPTTTAAPTTPTTTEEPPACNGSIDVKGKYSVYLYNREVSKSDAVAACNALDLELASLPSEEHFTAVREYLLANCSGTDGWWVDLEKHSNGWRWGNGTMLSDQNSKFWATNKPNDNNERLARMDNGENFFLNDVGNSEQFNCICVSNKQTTTVR